MKMKGGTLIREKVTRAANTLVNFYKRGYHADFNIWLDQEETLLNELFDTLLEAGTGRELKG